MSRLDARHHTLIQALLNRGPLHEKEVNLLFKSVCGNPTGARERDFHEYIGNINRELDFLHLEARASRNQYDGEVFYAIVNKVADEYSKFGTQLSPAQIAFFKAVIEAILQDPSGRGQISNIEALNIRLDTQARQESQSDQSQIPLAFRQFSMAQKEKTLEELIKNRWLSSMDEGRVGLGVRAFIELKNLFKNFDVPFCDVCNEAGIKAMLCKNEQCTVRMHEYCAQRKFQLPQAPRVCPSCGTDWECSGLNFELPDLNQTNPSEGKQRIQRPEKRRKLSRS